MKFEKVPKVFAGDNEELHKIIVWIWNLSKTSRNEGFLALEEYVDDCFSDIKNEEIRSFGRQFLAFALELFDEKELSELADSYISQSELEGEELLCLTVAADGILRIMKGGSTESLIKKLLFTLGFRNQKVLCEKIVMDLKKAVSLAEFCEEKRGCEAGNSAASEGNGGEEMEKLNFLELMELNDEQLMKLIENFSVEEWALALKTADVAVQDRIFTLLSKIQASTIKNLMIFSGPVKLSDIANVQEEIQRKIRE